MGGGWGKCGSPVAPTVVMGVAWDGQGHGIPILRSPHPGRNTGTRCCDRITFGRSRLSQGLQCPRTHKPPRRQPSAAPGVPTPQTSPARKAQHGTGCLSGGVNLSHVFAVCLGSPTFQGANYFVVLSLAKVPHRRKDMLSPCPVATRKNHRRLDSLAHAYFSYRGGFHQGYGDNQAAPTW